MSAQATAPPTDSATADRTGKARRLLALLYKALLGALLCQSLLGAMLVVGWTCRWMQRCVLAQWVRRSDTTFLAFVDAAPETRGHVTWPGWLAAPRPDREPSTFSGGPRRVLGNLFGSLGLNLRLGLGALSGTFVLTLPACALWSFAWTAGWHISFHKVYEESHVGILTGLGGTALYVTAMLYVPLAQARHAATGAWRRFFDFRVVWTVARRRWPACLGLAALYDLLGLAVTATRSAPLFFSEIPRQRALLAPLNEVQRHAAAAEFLGKYYFTMTLILLPAFLLLRRLAARIYADGLLDAVRSGAIGADRLGAFERSALERLDLLKGPKAGAAATGILPRLGRTAGTCVLLGLWFVFVAEIFVAQFLNYTGNHGWLNHPLVQLPVLRFVPAGPG